MDRCRALHIETQLCYEKTKLLLIEISRSQAASGSPVLADRVALIRDRFQQLSEDVEELWREYEAASH